MIKDLNFVLFKYWIYYRYDVFTNIIVSQKQLFIQKVKVLILTICLFSCIVRYIIYLFSIKSGYLPLYYFEIIQYVGGIIEMAYLFVIIMAIHAISLIYVMNTGHNYDWFKIIQVLNGFELWSRIGLSNRNVIHGFIHKIKIIKQIINYVLIYTLAFGIFFVITVVLFSIQ